MREDSLWDGAKSDPGRQHGMCFRHRPDLSLPLDRRGLRSVGGPAPIAPFIVMQSRTAGHSPRGLVACGSPLDLETPGNR